jgi:hypothetical protein
MKKFKDFKTVGIASRGNTECGVAIIVQHFCKFHNDLVRQYRFYQPKSILGSEEKMIKYSGSNYLKGS